MFFKNIFVVLERVLWDLKKFQLIWSVTAQKMKFSINNFLSKSDPQETANLVTITEEILNGKRRF